MRCLENMKITEILRLKEMNLFTYRDIAQSVGCSKTAVGDVLNRCKACGLTYESASTMSQDQINSLVYPESFGPGRLRMSLTGIRSMPDCNQAGNSISSIYGRTSTDRSIPTDTVTADSVPSMSPGRKRPAKRLFSRRNANPARKCSLTG